MMDHLDDSYKTVDFTIQDQLSTQSSPCHSEQHFASFEQSIQEDHLSNHQTNIRERYLSRLMQHGLLFDRPRKKCHHIAIFDWDDTLFCTSHLERYDILFLSQLNQKDSLKIQQIDSRTSSLLSTAAELSLVYIITNAVDGWVEHCLKHFMPNTKNAVKQFGVTIISARKKYEKQSPWEPEQWKRQAFRDILEPINKNLVTLNLTCIGDSPAQLKAAQQVLGLFSKNLLKTVKFSAKPRMDELCKQLNLLNENIRKIIISTKNMQIKLLKK